MEAAQSGPEKVKAAIKEHPKGLSVTAISELLGISRNTVSKYLDMLKVSGEVEMRTLGPAKVYTISSRVPIHAMLDLSSDHILLLDDRMRIVQVNDPVLKLLNKHREWLLGRSLAQGGVSFLSEELILEAVREALEGSDRTLEIEWAEADPPQYFKVRAIPTKISEYKNGATLILEDVTESRTAKEDLSYSEEKYRALFENAEMAILINDDEGHIECNKAMKRLFGTEKNALIRERINGSLMPPTQPDGRDSKTLMREYVARVMRGESVEFNWVLRDINGSDIPTHITFSPVTIKGKRMRMAIVSDMSKQMEEQSKILKLYHAVEAAADSIIILDMSGRVTDLNGSAVRMLNLQDRSDVLGENWYRDIANQSDIPILEERFAKLLDEGYATGINTRVRRGDGTSFPIEVSAALIRDASGSPKGIITVSRDISEKQFIMESMRKRDRLMNAISDSVRTLVETEFSMDGMIGMLRLMCDAVDASRSYVLRLDKGKEGDLLGIMVCGWDRVMNYPQTDEEGYWELSAGGFKRWIETMEKEGVIHGPVSTFPPSEREKLEGRGVRSILAVPIFRGGRWIAIIGFEDRILQKDWSFAEIETMKIASNIASFILSRDSAIPTHLLVAGDPLERGDGAPEGDLPG